MTEKQEDRYIKFDGDPVHKPWWKSFHRSIDFDVGTLATAFMAAAAYLQNPRSVLMVAAGGIAGMAIGSAASRYSDRNIYSRVFGNESKTLCIDTKPGPETPDTSHENIFRAKLTLAQHKKDTYVTGTVTMLGNLFLLPAFMLASNFHHPAVIAFTAFVVTALSLAHTTAGRSVSSQHRFQKVDNGEWVIVGTPAYQKQEEKEASFLEAMIPQAAPG